MELLTYNTTQFASRKKSHQWFDQTVRCTEAAFKQSPTGTADHREKAISSSHGRNQKTSATHIARCNVERNFCAKKKKEMES